MCYAKTLQLIVNRLIKFSSPKACRHAFIKFNRAWDSIGEGDVFININITDEKENISRGFGKILILGKPQRSTSHALLSSM
jgi:hypothetical protein